MHVEAHGTEIPLLRIPIHADSDVQAGIERWAFEQDTGAVCALSAAPSLLLVQLMRFQPDERGEPLKRMAACQIPARLQVPVFLAGIHTAPCAFELCSGLFHIGQSTRAGHYRAFGYTTPHKASEIGLAPATAPERATLRTLLRGGSAEGTVIVHDDNQPPQHSSVQNLSDILHNAYILVYIRV